MNYIVNCNCKNILIYLFLTGFSWQISYFGNCVNFWHKDRSMEHTVRFKLTLVVMICNICLLSSIPQPNLRMLYAVNVLVLIILYSLLMCIVCAYLRQPDKLLMVIRTLKTKPCSSPGISKAKRMKLGKEINTNLRI